MVHLLTYLHDFILLCLLVALGAANVHPLYKGNIKYIHSKGEEGVKAKAYTNCFYYIILLFKCVQGRRKGLLKIKNFLRMYFTNGPKGQFPNNVPFMFFNNFLKAVPVLLVI